MDLDSIVDRGGVDLGSVWGRFAAAAYCLLQEAVVTTQPQLPKICAGTVCHRARSAQKPSAIEQDLRRNRLPSRRQSAKSGRRLQPLATMQPELLKIGALGITCAAAAALLLEAALLAD